MEKTNLKIKIEVMPKIDSVSSLIGDKLLDSIIEIMNLHQDLKNIVARWKILEKQRFEAADAADEYLRSELRDIPPDENRRYVVHGIEYEMKELLKKRDHIQKVLETVLYPQK